MPYKIERKTVLQKLPKKIWITGTDKLLNGGTGGLNNEF